MAKTSASHRIRDLFLFSCLEGKGRAKEKFDGKYFVYIKIMSQLESLESSLELFIENVRQLGIIVSDFQPQGQTILNQKM